MIINYASDLHIDIGKSLPDFPGGEVLILAGDTCEARHYRKNIIDRYGVLDDPNCTISNKDRINGFLAELGRRYKHVIMVAGNHEHYHAVFDKTITKMRENLPVNFHILDNECFELDDVLFIGGTLWTDCNRGDPMTMHALKYGMNDFDCVRKMKNNEYPRFTPFDSIMEHEKTLKFFRIILNNPLNDGKKIVIVSHHAPTHMSVHPRYASDHLMNGGYYSRLDDLILDHPQIKYWVHGHTHTVFNYMVGDDTRVLCNPRGYHMTHGGTEYTGWDPGAAFEI